MQHVGLILIFLGFIVVGLGLWLYMGWPLPPFGRLPGDIAVKKENFSFYFPLTTSIVLSIILTLMMYFFKK